ncbi:MAG: helix-turn-helix domain-containing protein [Flavobacteriaceae bacterium]|jgi:hypothetical protein|nr:helix-turn-helix domain-containing protein [Flavobacteriaceae bacterium]|tara:strand:+ start:1044 stop:1349 length:306 start_codon:yes stop_codon:yes gene_type:complete
MKEQDKTIQFIQVTPEDLVELFAEALKIQFQELSNNQKIESTPTNQREFITRKETAELFGVSLPTIHSWTKLEILKAYKQGNRTYYKYSELLEQLYKSNVA